MEAAMTFGSLFSGIGGFEVGLEQAGMEVAWQIEVDPPAQFVLKHHWPDVPLYEDVKNVRPEDLGPVDIVCAGPPCQGFSVAGRRRGLEDARSHLFWEVIRICSALSPRWILIENVTGLLSSNGGRDMGAILGALEDLGYGWTYRVLDAQFFGVPQRRRRVFIVGHLGGEPRPEVLLEPEGLQGDSPPSREEGEEVTRSLTTGSGGGRYDRQPRVVAHTLRSRGCDASEDGTGRGTPLVAQTLTTGTGRRYDPETETILPDVTDTVRSHPRPGSNSVGNIVAMNLRGREGGAMPETDDVASLRSASGGSSRSYVAFHNRQDPDVSGDVTHPLGTKDNGMAVAFSVNSRRDMGVRRLTPRECARLQGFPDDHLDVVDDRDKPLSDTARYRLLGNAVAVPVAKWIGKRIMEAEGAEGATDTDHLAHLHNHAQAAQRLTTDRRRTKR
jgi:DNA (cytosine-5)-methyltransferase 1